MHLLTSSLKSIINAFLNGQLVPQGEGKGGIPKRKARDRGQVRNVKREVIGGGLAVSKIPFELKR